MLLYHMHHPLNLRIVYYYLPVQFKLIFIITFNCEFLICLYEYFRWWCFSDTFVFAAVFLLYLPEDGHISGRNML
jgi:hypothetical protein